MRLPLEIAGKAPLASVAVEIPAGVARGTSTLKHVDELLRQDIA